MIDVDKNPLSEKYDKELVNIKMLIEKMGKDNYKSLVDMIKNSPRKNKIINSNDTLKFFHEINYSHWMVDISNTIDDNYVNHDKIIKIIDRMLKIVPNDRIMSYN
jgi:hypothetical protein